MSPKYLLALTAALCFLKISGSGIAAESYGDKPWLNPNLSADERASLLQKKLNPEQVTQYLAPQIGTKSAGLMVGIPEYGMPTIKEADSPVGVTLMRDNTYRTTSNVSPIGVTATWNLQLAYNGGAMIGAEAHQVGVGLMLAPGANLAREARNGRNYEYAGEDPLLGGQMMGAVIRGIQSNHVGACIKHYAFNDQESSRRTYNAVIGERAARQSDLLLFQIAIQEGDPASVMCAYNEVNGVHACQNKELLQTALKDDWGWKGWVLTDWSAEFGTAVDGANGGLDQESAATFPEGFSFGGFGGPGVNAGGSGQNAGGSGGGTASEQTPMGVQSIIGPGAAGGNNAGGAPGGMPGGVGGGAKYDKPLKEAVKNGQVSQARYDDMLHRILRSLFDKGVVDDPPVDKGEFDAEAHQAVVQSVAEEAAVLLKNDGDLLPLSDKSGSVVLIAGSGGRGNMPDMTALFGGGGGPGGNSAPGGAPTNAPAGGNADSVPLFSPMAGGNAESELINALKQQAPNVTISSLFNADPQKAAEAARGAGVAVVVARQELGEGQDAANLSLPGNQDELIKAVAEANPNTVVLLETSGPVTMPWLSQVKAVLEAWRPGTTGEKAVARILFGAVNPSGRLPVTFPMSEDQQPRKTIDGYSATAGFSGAGADVDVNYNIEGQNAGYKWYDLKGLTPLFPFGYGLSYTTFSFSKLKAEGSKTVTVSFDVTNTGKREGKQVAQVYLGFAPESGEAPRRLIAYWKVDLKPGETRHVTLTIQDPKMLGVWDEASHGWKVNAGEYPVYVGGSSRDLPLKGSVKLKASTAPAGVKGRLE